MSELPWLSLETCPYTRVDSLDAEYLEDCAKVHAPVKNSEPYFEVDPIFMGASYAKRYEMLCERLVLERKYTSACLALGTNSAPSEISFPAANLNFRQFAAAAESHARGFIIGRR